MPVAILAILVFAIVGLVLFRVAADQKPRRVDQKPRRVVLTWKPSPPKPGVTVAGYEIYRSQADGPFKKLASGVTSPTYTDTQVKSGETYHYYVTAINPAGGVSPASNRVDVEIH